MTSNPPRTKKLTAREAMAATIYVDNDPKAAQWLKVWLNGEVGPLSREYSLEKSARYLQCLRRLGFVVVPAPRALKGKRK